MPIELRLTPMFHAIAALYLQLACKPQLNALFLNQLMEHGLPLRAETSESVVRHIMTLSSNAILFIGYGLTGVFATMGFLKVLRSNKRLILITVIAVVVAFGGVILSSTKTDADAENVVAILAGPLVYVLLYTLLRYVYKVIYKVEPTYNRMSWYDEEEGRRQNWMDVFVHVVPMMIAFAFPLFFM